MQEKAGNHSPPTKYRNRRRNIGVTNVEMPQKLGRYEVVRVLGKGAMGVVYEGRDPNINRRVAIKTARRDIMEASGMADEMMERFLREARAAGVLNHTNIITIYDAAEQDGVAYIAMEYLEGGDLLDAIQRRQSFSMDEIAEMGATVCEALAAAHDQGVVHRDVKPANIILPENGPLKIADFGIARVSDSNLTQEGALIGTPHYMSPEQFMGQKVDGRSDLFSVGIILYEMLTGERPFSGEALSTVMHHVIKSMPAVPTELNYAVPDALAQVVMKALSKRPSERYQDGRAMAAALRDSLKTKPNPDVLGFTLAVPSESTVTRPVAAGQATVLSASTPGMPPAPSGQETTITHAPTPAPVSPQVSAGLPAGVKKVHKSVWVGGIAVVALILAGILAYVERGGSPGTTAPGNTPPPGAPDDKYYAKIALQLWHPNDMKVVEVFNDGGKNFDLIRSQVEEIPAADLVEIMDAKGRVVKSVPQYKSGENIVFERQPTISWRVVVGGEEIGKETEPTANAPAGGSLIRRDVLSGP